MNPISKAAEKAGGQAALAKLLGISSQAVNRMCTTGRVPAERVLAIEAATGVTRHELRPDLYPEDKKTVA